MPPPPSERPDPPHASSSDAAAAFGAARSGAREFLRRRRLLRSGQIRRRRRSPRLPPPHATSSDAATLGIRPLEAAPWRMCALMAILSVPVPAASMGSFEVVCVLTSVLLYSKVIAPALRGLSARGDGEPSQLQRMGAGRLLMALSIAVAALVEMKRLDGAARGETIGISWQMPQYFFLAGGEVFCYIAQLEFFYAEAPDTMKSTCKSLALLTMALGNYMSSLLYAVVAAFTATAGSPGWICDDLNKGHLDYLFGTMAAMCTLNFVIYSAFAKNYKLKKLKL